MVDGGKEENRAKTDDDPKPNTVEPFIGDRMAANKPKGDAR